MSQTASLECALLTYIIDRLTLNDDDKKVRGWFVEETKKYGCHHKVSAPFQATYSTL